jgi:hypothetical protein
MEKYIPLISIDELDSNKIILSNDKTYNIVHYNFNDLYCNIPLNILIKNCCLALDSYNNLLSNNSKLFEFRNILDTKIKTFNDKDNNINKISNGAYVKLNFNKNISKAYLHPSKKSGKQTILVKSEEDFIKIFKEYYPRYYSKNIFDDKIQIYADIIIQPYFLANNNFCSLAVYDADIGYEKIKKNIINNNIVKEVIYNTPEVYL